MNERPTAVPTLTAIELAVFVVLLVVIVGQSFYLVTYVSEQRRQADTLACQTRANELFRDALAARTDASARERQAQRMFLRSSLDGITPAELQSYLRALDEADRDRANNPLPSTRC